MNKKIAIIGPESTGKTTLCSQLAKHYQTVWVPEFAREYISKLKTKYTLQDIEYCASEQIKQEQEHFNKANTYLFVDTELIIAKVWCEDSFQVCPPWIEEAILSNPFDYYLLITPDIDWIKDNVRENENRRDYFFNLYQKELDDRGFSYSIISGSGASRTKNAIKAIESFFS